jgi:phosphatidylserine decarboxylase
MLTPYGRNVWLPIVIIATILSGAFALMGWWIVVGVVVVLALALLSFFRDPPRRIPANLAPGDMLSPADGVVSAVLDVDHHEAVDGPAKIVRIFLSVLNVHVNRSPCDGEVVSVTPRPGKYLNAQTDESAAVNESNLIVLKTSAGGAEERIGIRQVSGMLARTIVCPLRPGVRLKRGQKFGMIKFGSTTELILPRPKDVTVHVQKGDRVRGGLTLLATLAPRPPHAPRAAQSS